MSEESVQIEPAGPSQGRTSASGLGLWQPVFKGKLVPDSQGSLLVGHLGWHRTFFIAWAVAILWSGSLALGAGAILRGRSVSDVVLTLVLMSLFTVVPILALWSSYRLGLRERHAFAEFLMKLLDGRRLA